MRMSVCSTMALQLRVQEKLFCNMEKHVFFNENEGSTMALQLRVRDVGVFISLPLSLSLPP